MTPDNQLEEKRPAVFYFGLLDFGVLGPKWKVLSEIAEHVYHARTKHPVFARSRWQALRVLFSEVWEFLWAVFWERDPVRIREEALDVIAVLVRWIEGDMEAGK